MPPPVAAPRAQHPSCPPRVGIGWAPGVLLELGTDDASFLVRDATPGMLGWTRRDLAVIPADQLIHPDDRDVVPDGPSSELGGSAPFVPFELRLLARDGRYWRTRWYLCSRPGGGFGALADAVLGPEADVGPAVGVWEWDTGSDTVAWSVELLDMFGFRARPPGGYQRALDVVLPEDRPSVARHVERAARSGDPFVVTFRGAAPGRRDRWFQATGRRREDDGRRRLGGIVKDLNPACAPGHRARVIGCG